MDTSRSGEPGSATEAHTPWPVGQWGTTVTRRADKRRVLPRLARRERGVALNEFAAPLACTADFP